MLASARRANVEQQRVTENDLNVTSHECIMNKTNQQDMFSCYQQTRWTPSPPVWTWTILGPETLNYIIITTTTKKKNQMFLVNITPASVVEGWWVPNTCFMKQRLVFQAVDLCSVKGHYSHTGGPQVALQRSGWEECWVWECGDALYLTAELTLEVFWSETGYLIYLSGSKCGEQRTSRGASISKMKTFTDDTVLLY